MVLWCATDTCDDIAEYFYTCAMNINRWKCSRAAFVGFHTCDPAAKRSTSRAWCHDSTFGSGSTRGDRCLVHQWAREVTRGAVNLPRPTRGWESVSWIYAPPKRRITTSASLPSKRSSAPQTGFARKKSFKSQILDLSSCTVQEYIYVGGIDPLVAAIACESSFSTAILTHGLLLFRRVPIHRRFKRWYKALKIRVVQVKYEEKGVTLLWI